MELKEVETIRVGGYTFVVSIDNHQMETVQLLGRCVTDDLRIIMRDNAPKAILAETLLHEVVHAIFDVYMEGIDDKINSEHVVAMISQGFFQVLQDNPEFTYFVSGGFEDEEEEDEPDTTCS